MEKPRRAWADAALARRHLGIFSTLGIDFVAEFEREMIIERVRAGSRQYARKADRRGPARVKRKIL
jgi:hypothetical protein